MLLFKWLKQHLKVKKNPAARPKKLSEYISVLPSFSVNNDKEFDRPFLPELFD